MISKKMQVGQESEQVATQETEPKETNQAVTEEITEQISEVFIQMLEKHPLHRSGAISPDKRIMPMI